MKTIISKKGFTLIEVLIALVILSVGLSALIPVLVHTVRGNSYGGMTSEAATYSQDKLEEFRVEPFEDLVVSTGTDTPSAGFTRTWVIDDTCPGCSSDLLGIEVTTTWTDGQGIDHSSTFFTIRADHR